MSSDANACQLPLYGRWSGVHVGQQRDEADAAVGPSARVYAAPNNASTAPPTRLKVIDETGGFIENGLTYEALYAAALTSSHWPLHSPCLSLAAHPRTRPTTSNPLPLPCLSLATDPHDLCRYADGALESLDAHRRHAHSEEAAVPKGVGLAIRGGGNEVAFNMFNSQVCLN